MEERNADRSATALAQGVERAREPVDTRDAWKDGLAERTISLPMSAVDRWHEEKQSAWIYRVLVQVERGSPRSKLFEELSEAAEGQASLIAGDLRGHGREVPEFQPSLRAIAAVAIVRRIGVDRSLPMLAALKVRGLSAPRDRRAHDGHPMPTSAAEIGKRHERAGSGGSLRAAVFGANDGLVSNASLILGFAGASAEPRAVMLAGVAGLLAGAFSMAAGEWVSVRTQRELYELQIAEEREELARYPEEEAEELALIYAARGIPLEQARKLTHELLKEPQRMLDALSREELGLDPDSLGSPWGASIASFFAFAIGASLPLAAFVVPGLEHRVEIAIAVSALALFGFGAAMSLFSGRSAWFGGARMLAIGSCAGAATYFIGRWLGVALV